MAEEMVKKVRTASPEKVAAVALTIDHDLNMRKYMNKADRIGYRSKEAIKRLEDLGSTSRRREIFAEALAKTDYVIQMSLKDLEWKFEKDLSLKRYKYPENWMEQYVCLVPFVADIDRNMFPIKCKAKMQRKESLKAKLKLRLKF